MEVARYDETKNQKRVTDPASRSGKKMVVFTDPSDGKPNLDRASETLAKIEKLFKKSGNLGPQMKDYVGVVHNTCLYFLSLLKDKHKLDEFLTDFERDNLDRKFNWDLRKVVKDRMFKKISYIIKRCVDVIDDGRKKYSLDDDPKLYDEMEKYLQMGPEFTSKTDYIRKHPPYHLDTYSLSREDLLSMSEGDIKNLKKQRIKEIIDSSLDNKDIEIFNKFSPYYESRRVENFQNFDKRIHPIW